MPGGWRNPDNERWTMQCNAQRSDWLNDAARSTSAVLSELLIEPSNLAMRVRFPPSALLAGSPSCLLEVVVERGPERVLGRRRLKRGA